MLPDLSPLEEVQHDLPVSSVPGERPSVDYSVVSLGHWPTDYDLTQPLLVHAGAIFKCNHTGGSSF